MRPQSIPPNQAPGGVVVIAFDLNEEEVTRQSLTIENENDVAEMAMDAGDMVAERGGGGMSCYDGDSGALMWEGPMRLVNTHVTHHIDSLDEAVDGARAPDDEWPWGLIGVFKAESQRTDDDVPNAWWDHFVYTIGMSGPEVWTSCISIEGRGADHQMVAAILNRIAAGIQMGVILPGDTVQVPLGVANQPDADDVISLWWIGEPTHDHDRYYQTFQSRNRWVIPIRWSSPLGFEYVTKSGKVLTDGELDEWADEAARGYDVSRFTEATDG